MGHFILLLVCSEFFSNISTDWQGSENESTYIHLIFVCIVMIREKKGQRLFLVNVSNHMLIFGVCSILFFYYEHFLNQKPTHLLNFLFELCSVYNNFVCDDKCFVVVTLYFVFIFIEHAKAKSLDKLRDIYLDDYMNKECQQSNKCIKSTGWIL